MFELTPAATVALAGLLCGLAFGALVRATRFCTFCAIRYWYESGDLTRARAWALAIATATIGVQALHQAGVARIDQAFYLVPQLGWAGALVGGLVFGFGMTLVRSCGFNLVVRTATGDLRGLVALLVMGLSAYMAARGITGMLRVRFIEPLAIDATAAGGQGLPQLIGAATGIAAERLWLPVGALVAAALAAWCFADGEFRRARMLALSGVAVGLLVVAGFAATGILGADEFEPTPVESLSFVRPTGDFIVYLLTFSGASIDFAVALIFGTLGGAFLVARLAGDAHWRGFADLRELGQHIAGAFLMGFGAVTALGCTIGQGVTGLATLSAGSPIAVAATIAGALAALRYTSDRKNVAPSEARRERDPRLAGGSPAG